MASQVKFYDYINQLHRGAHLWQTHVYKVMLSNTAPTTANAIKTDITEISAGSGYTAGGTASTITIANASGTITVSGTQVVFTSTGTIGPFRYAVLYNSTQTTPASPLVSYVDYGSALTLNNTDTLTIQFNSATPGTIFTAA